jgi:hypothetical protein
VRTIEEIQADIEAVKARLPEGRTNTDLCELKLEMVLALAKDIDIDRLREICAAERDGRCVVLPCKVGDAVYPIDIDRSLDKPPLRVTAVRFTGFELDGWVEIGCLKYKFSDIGKTVYLTRESAEAALKGASNEE